MARSSSRATLPSVVALLACWLGCITFAHADALDDTLSKFLDDKFSQTSAAIGELAASGSPEATPCLILKALEENRLLIDPDARRLGE